MTERPILFSAPMVRAILAGAKTQTRRVMPHQPPEILPGYAPKVYWPARDRHMTSCPHSAAYMQIERPGDYDGMHVMRGGFGFRCPYGQPGDQVWVRETFAHIYRDNAKPDKRRDDDVAYKADCQGIDEYAYGTWKPSIHMLRWASRITLEITAVRVERLQAISEADAIAEGIHRTTTGLWSGGAWKHMLVPNRYEDPCNAYCDLWASINGPGSWDANPWVWVVEFKRIKPEAA